MSRTIGRRHLVQGIGAAGAGLTLSSAVQAQDSVDSLKILVGFPPGGSADVVARHLATS